MRSKALAAIIMLSFMMASPAMAADTNKPMNIAQYEAALTIALSDLKKAENNPAKYAIQLARYNDLNTEYKRTLALMTK